MTNYSDTHTDFGLIEMGSNSLKYYKIAIENSRYSIKTYKTQWSVAHDYFDNGYVSNATCDEIIRCLASIEPMNTGFSQSTFIALATGVFREIENLGEISLQIKRRTGVRVRVISGSEEAKLMARSFDYSPICGESVFLADVGGATTEWAYLYKGALKACGSLRLGAIRNKYMLKDYKGMPELYKKASAAFCDARLANLPLSEPVQVIATGGTVKAASRCLDTTSIHLDALKGLIDNVARCGAPVILKPSRQAVFLPGLIIMWRLIERCRTDMLAYGKASVKQGMAERLMALLGSFKAEDLHATMLLHSTAIKHAL